jgi:cytochrome c oxidase accessory protein FixG
MSQEQTKSSSDKTSDIQTSLYERRKKIYPREVHGIFAFWRNFSMVALLGTYYILPWLKWNGEPMVLLDLPARKFYLFGMTLWPQDFIYLTGILIVAALSLFFFTAIAGRLWCGYACPQTVWTEIFLWIERKIEGDRPRQMKLDKAPWTPRKVLVKTAKHSIWLVFAGFTGLTFVGYFTPMDVLIDNVMNLSAGPWETFWIIFYSFATWGNAGFLREQVCIYMCPYARFQSAMFDKNTLIISYDTQRGEPRGSRKKSDDPAAAGLGDCIDCTMCVQVCPTGIDIRDGLQYQCIGCAACIDICDEVMDKMNYQRGLVRYTTLNALEGIKVKVLRPRIIIYALILLSIMAALGYSIVTRIPLQLDVIRDRNSLYRETDEGLIENVYTLKVLNMDNKDHVYSLEVDGVDGVIVKMDKPVISAQGGNVIDVVVRLQADPYDLSKRSSEVSFTLEANDNTELTVTETARFLGPVK